jgi:hypothetical protein
MKILVDDCNNHDKPIGPKPQYYKDRVNPRAPKGASRVELDLIYLHYNMRRSLT